jgi:hypothetical protein
MSGKSSTESKKDPAKLHCCSKLNEALFPEKSPTLPNACAIYATISEEQRAREDAVAGQLNILRRELPQLLKRLERIPDPRNPR